MANREFTVRRYRDITIKEGWGVNIIPIWDEREHLDEKGEVVETSEFVSDIETEIVEIREDLVRDIHGEPCIALASPDSYVPVDTFKEYETVAYDDTHDLRDRWFATREEAEEHADYTVKRFRNPQPWESFVMGV